jgi:predicted nucleotidyltransferase
MTALPLTRPWLPEADWPFGIAPTAHAKLLRLFGATPGLRQVWIYGSRARGDQRRESDIDLVADMPEGHFAGLATALDDLGLIYRTDLLHWQSTLTPELRTRIERDRRPFWPVPAGAAHAA